PVLLSQSARLPRLSLALNEWKDCLTQSSFSQSAVFGLDLITDVMAPQLLRGDARRPRAVERIQDDIPLVGEQLNNPSGQLNRKRRRMPDSSCRLWWYIPDRQCSCEKFIPRKVAFSLLRPTEALLYKHQEILMDVPQSWRFREEPGSPSATVVHTLSFSPDDFAGRSEPDLHMPRIKIVVTRAIG